MIRLVTLGAVHLERADGSEARSVLAQPKRLALLAFLAANHGGYHRRDTLLGLFWPELDDQRARAALNQSLYYLRQSLGAGPFVTRGKEEVGIAPDEFWCDAVEFQRLLELRTAEAYEAALSLYRGDFLPGFFLPDADGFERWMDSERLRLRQEAADAARFLSAKAEDDARLSEAIRWGQRALDLGAPDERLLRRLIELLDRMDDRAGAVHVFEETTRRWRLDHGVEPSVQTCRMVDRLKSAPATVPAAPQADAAQDSIAERSPPPQEPRAPAPAPPPATSRPRRFARVALAVAASAAALLGLASIAPSSLTFLAGRQAYPSSERTTQTIAVLPLRHLGPDSGDAFVADGLTAELISRLSRLRSLRVVPFTSIMAYRQLDRPFAEIEPDLVVEGTTRRTGDAFRMTVQLIRASSGELVWAGAYDAALDELLDVQRQVAEQVALRLSIDARIRTGAAAIARTRNPEAAEEYLRGRALLGRGEWSAVTAARDHFELAAQHDPTFAEAWSGLAFANNQLTRIGAAANGEPWEETREAALRALRLDEELPEAHAALAVVHAFAD